MKKRIFVTATNTNIGKTYTTLKLLQEYASRGIKVGAIKLIETGVKNGTYPDGDMIFKLLKELNPAFNDLTIHDIVPISYELPAAPYIASNGVSIDFDILNNAIQKIENISDIIIIEGAGGLLVPVDSNFMMVDLISFFNAKALLVTHCSLGCINDTMLSLGLLQNRGIDAMLLFNCRDKDKDFAMLSEPYFINHDINVLKTSDNIDTVCDVLYNL